MVRQQAGEVLAHQAVAEDRVLVLGGEGVLAVARERLVDVHAVARLEQERLGHEGDVQPVTLGAQADDVLEVHGVIGHLHHRPVAHVDLGLPGAVLDVARLDLDARLPQRLADVEHERLHLPASVDGVAVDVVVDRLPLGSEEVALELGRSIDAEAERLRARELALEHLTRVHLDRLVRVDVDGVAHDDADALGPARDAEAGEVGDGVHVGEAVGLVRPRGWRR